jgi:hypothetical protein
MNDAELERLVADLPWATPGSGLDGRVQTALRTATARARVATAVTVVSLIAASLATVWIATGRHRDGVDHSHPPLAGDGSAGGGTAPATGGASSQAASPQSAVGSRACVGGGLFGMPGPGGAVAVLAAFPAGPFAADAAATFARVSPLLEPVGGVVGLMFTALSSVTPPGRADRSDPRTGWRILERRGPRGVPWPTQVG